MFFWKIPAPDQAMLISGGKGAGGKPFRVVVGHGAFKGPFRRIRMLPLYMQESEVLEGCVTRQGIQVTVKAVIAFKVGGDDESIINAGQRFVSDADQMPTLVGRIFAGHLRSIVGSMTVEEIVTERQKLATEVLDGSKLEMAKIGLVVDAFQIQEIQDRTGYIDQMSAPHRAAIEQQAKIAQANAVQAATEAEQAAQRKQLEYQRQTSVAQADNEAQIEQAAQQTEAKKAQYARDTAKVRAQANQDVQVAQAQAQAQIDRAAADAAQAGPLAQAQNQLAITQAQTELAAQQAELKQRQLEIDVIKPAEAQARETEIAANAEAARQKVLAEAAASSNRISLDQQLIEQAPALVAAAAGALAGANVTVINGAEGVSEMLTGAVTQGMGLLNAVRKGLAAQPHANGEAAKDLARR